MLVLLFAGAFQNKVNQLKCMSTLITPFLLQTTIADYSTSNTGNRIICVLTL